MKTIKPFAIIVLLACFLPISREWFKYLEYFFDDEVSSVNELRFRELTSSTAEVVCLLDYNHSDIIIPSKVLIGMRVHTVTCIKDNAFSGCNNLESVKIPMSVTSIGDSAFYRCARLNQVDIPSSVTSIGKHAFESCLDLVHIEIPTSATSITSIGEHAFNGCLNLESVKMPSSVTIIEDATFRFCRKLEHIEIPSNVTII